MARTKKIVPEKETKTIKVNSFTAVLYVAPEPSEVICKLEYLQELELIEKVGSYAKVKVNDKIGFVKLFKVKE